jgi:hypothetical protein
MRQARSWNKQGVPLKAKLVSLDLEAVTEEIGTGGLGKMVSSCWRGRVE